MSTRNRLIAATLTLALFTAACGDDAEEVAAGDTPAAVDPDTPVDDGDAGTGQPGDDPADDPGSGWERIDPTDDLVNPIVATPDELVVDPDDPSAVLVRFFGGVPECYGARATAVSQTADAVTIRLEVGGRPDIPADTACIEIAMSQELRVELDAPLGDRSLEADLSAAPGDGGSDEPGAPDPGDGENRSGDPGDGDGDDAVSSDPNAGDGGDTSDPNPGDGGDTSDPNPGDGSGTSPGSPGDGTIDPNDPVDPGDPIDVTWQRIPNSSDVENPGIATPDQLVVDPADPSAVLVRFWGGVPECFAARAAVVEQSADTVRIRLEVGSNPGAGEMACIAIALAQEIRVELDAPLGDRTLEAARR